MRATATAVALALLVAGAALVAAPAAIAEGSAESCTHVDPISGEVTVHPHECVPDGGDSTDGDP